VIIDIKKVFCRRKSFRYHANPNNWFDTKVVGVMIVILKLQEVMWLSYFGIPKKPNDS
jgi:hypothetical protein